ncbi:MAG: hypothetical protein CMM46_08080 [Rhodospirillaceae bacterium]|mgnify:FL=1|nr:hypothetical protein [Rhodospirillaceae bacterium]|tara:strand:+ start:16447 stop:16941 length:495 start_codon:yes stop_codon:yes gene_type:complete
MAQPTPDGAAAGLPSDLPVFVAMSAGGPVLAIPFAGDVSIEFRKVMMCWNDSREASRAFHDSISLIGDSAKVDVVCVDPSHASDRDPGAEMAGHLSRHGFETEAHKVDCEGLSVADALLAASADLESDLIVMGAYGHARLREVVLGGITRRVMQQMPVPVLLTH